MSDELNRNFKIKRIKNFTNFTCLLRIIYLIVYISIAKESLINPINYSSEINLVISGYGSQILLNNSFHPQPSMVFVYGIYSDSCKALCNLGYEQRENNIKLIFNDTLNSTELMFSGLDNIIEIDLSLFDFF